MLYPCWLQEEVIQACSIHWIYDQQHKKLQWKCVNCAGCVSFRIQVLGEGTRGVVFQMLHVALIYFLFAMWLFQCSSVSTWWGWEPARSTTVKSLLVDTGARQSCLSSPMPCTLPSWFPCLFVWPSVPFFDNNVWKSVQHNAALDFQHLEPSSLQVDSRDYFTQ